MKSSAWLVALLSVLASGCAVEEAADGVGSDEQPVTAAGRSYSCQGTNSSRPGGGSITYATGDFVLMDGLQLDYNRSVVSNASIVTDARVPVKVKLTDAQGGTSNAEGMLRSSLFARGAPTSWDNGSTLAMSLRVEGATVRGLMTHILAGGKTPIQTAVTCTAKPTPACPAGEYLRCTDKQACACKRGNTADVKCGSPLSTSALCTPAL